jgi:hypothetical protein
VKFRFDKREVAMAGKQSKGARLPKAAAAETKAAEGIAVALQEYEDALSKYGGSPCDRYILMAVHDQEVQRTLARHAMSGELFIGAYCLSGPGIPEEVRIVFEFRCPPPRICLLPKLVLVILNAFTGRVLRIVDPYFPGMEQMWGVQEPAPVSTGPASEPSPGPEASAAHHPAFAAHHPTLGAHHPTLGTHHPTLAAHHPGLAAHHPALAAHHPALAVYQLGLAAHHPALAAHHPMLGAHHPTLAAHHPSLAR